MVSLANYGEIEKVRLAGEGCLKKTKKKKNQFAKSKQPKRKVRSVPAPSFFVIEIVT